MTVKARFRCNRIVDTNSGGPVKVTRIVEFHAVYAKEGVNADFSKATPWGELKMQIDQETPAYNAFEPGKLYELTIEPVSE